MSTQKTELLEVHPFCLYCEKDVDEEYELFIKPHGMKYGPVHRRCLEPLMKVHDEVEAAIRDAKKYVAERYLNQVGLGF